MTAPTAKKIAAPDAEEAAVSSLMLDPYDVYAVATELRFHVGMFTNPKLAELWQVLTEMLLAGRTTDPVSLTEELRARQRLDALGGTMYLSAVAEKSPTSAHARGYFRAIRNAYIARKVSATTAVIQADCETTALEDAESFLKAIPERYMDIIDAETKRRTVKDILDEVEIDYDAIKRGEKTLGFSTGNSMLDKFLHGLRPMMLVIAGRPSGGKTSQEGSISSFVSGVLGKHVIRGCFDMSDRELIERDAARMAGVSLMALRGGYADAGEMQKWRDAKEVISTWPMHINSSDRTVESFIGYCRMMKAKGQCDLITIDYIQLMDCEGNPGTWDENTIITRVSMKLKALWQELKVPLIVLSQLSRKGEEAGSEPELRHLRGSGSLEQDASAVMFVWKAKPEEYAYESAAHEVKGPRAIWGKVAKNQQGLTGKFEQWFHCGTFRVEPAPDNWGQGPREEYR